MELKAGDPVIVTGGARGITATVAAELAGRWRPTLLLLGRSPLPQEFEDRETNGIAAGFRVEGRPPRQAPSRRATGLAGRRRAGLSGGHPGPRDPVQPRDPPGGRLDRGIRPGRRPRFRGAGHDPRPLASPVRRAGRADPRRRGDQGQVDPGQDARVVRPRAGHEARRRLGTWPGCSSPSPSGSPRSSRRSPGGSATPGNRTTRRRTRCSTSWRSGSTGDGPGGSSR